MRPSTSGFVARVPTRSLDEGFTLVEALVMLAIVAMAAVVAIPNLQRVLVKTRTTQAVAGVANAFDLARSEALRRHSPVAVVVAVGEGTGLIATVWEDWDPNNTALASNNNGVLDGAELVVDRHLVDPVIQFTGPPSNSLGTTVYRSDGSLQSAGGSILLQDRRGNAFRVLVNAVTGSTRLEMQVGPSVWEPRKEKWTWKY